MKTVEAIYRRRATRDYSDRPVDRATINMLLRAAVQAPSAINDQPWAFAVIQDREMLARFSARAEKHMLDTAPPGSRLHDLPMLRDPSFNMFYNAGTLIIICAKQGAMNPNEDCCFAAMNLMLAATDAGLATCPIGFARPWLSLPEVKAELGIPKDYTPITPLILGYPAHPVAPTPRRDPEVLFWK